MGRILISLSLQLSFFLSVCLCCGERVESDTIACFSHFFPVYNRVKITKKTHRRYRISGNNPPLPANKVCFIIFVWMVNHVEITMTNMLTLRPPAPGPASLGVLKRHKHGGHLTRSPIGPDEAYCGHNHIEPVKG